MTPELISGFALSSPFLRNKTGGRRWTTGIKVSDLGVPSLLHLGHIDMRMWRKGHSSTRHNSDISGAWTTFVLDKSEGFTQAGVERLNDSIRTYFWAILGAQAQTRSNILKTGTGFDAQKQFLANIEDAIASPVDIPSSIAR